MVIGDAEQSSRAWRLQRNEDEPAASERAPEAAQHVATEEALIVVVNGRHDAPSPSALSTLSPAFMNLMIAAGVQRRTCAYSVVVVSKNP